ncbi:MAG: hypothetical protein [Caudoviricetes sp.]|nr:MAG: hypothetical protein [Caudoviricetes sp.]
MRYLFYDTETTGFPDDYVPIDADSQPHCVQIAAIMTDESGSELSCINLTVKPDGWSIPASASRIHGITNEIASKIGIREVVAGGVFYDLICQSDMVVAHNEKFDRKIVKTMLARSRPQWKFKTPSECTMEMATPLLNLPPTDRMIAAGFDKPKPPKLEECYKFFFGEELKGAHDALIDVRACARVYWHIKRMGDNA